MLCTEFLGENETWPLTWWRTQSTGEETRVTKLTKRPTTVVKSVTRYEPQEERLTVLRGPGPIRGVGKAVCGVWFPRE